MDLLFDELDAKERAFGFLAVYNNSWMEKKKLLSVQCPWPHRHCMLNALVCPFAQGSEDQGRSEVGDSQSVRARMRTRTEEALKMHHRIQKQNRSARSILSLLAKIK